MYEEIEPEVQDEIDGWRRLEPDNPSRSSAILLDDGAVDLAGAGIAGETHVLLARPAEQGGNPPEGASIIAAIAPKHIKVRPESPVVSGVSA